MHGWEILRQLTKIQRTLIRRSQPDLQKQGLSTRVTLLLAAVKRYPHASDISRVLGVPAPTVSRLLKRLESEGMVLREAEASDLRRYHFRPTDKGREALAAGRKAMERQMDGLLQSHLSEDQVKTLLHLLSLLAQASGPEDSVLSSPGDDRGHE